jgi:SAM-dependent methyltransferase
MARWLVGQGIELGALHQPLAVPPGVGVEYVDRLDVDGLRRHYPELASLDLVPVGHVGTAEDLKGIGDATQDFVIACHVLEHLEDPTRGLAEIARVLREGGIFFCALPEPRVTFDRHRQLTAIDHLLVDHPAGRAPRTDHFIDWVENVERHQEWWSVEKPDPRARVSLLLDMDYSIHFHVWRPDTFLEYLAALRTEHGIVFEMLDFAGCAPGMDDEFIFILRKGVAALPVVAPDGVFSGSNGTRATDWKPVSGVGPGGRVALANAAATARVAATAVTAAARRRLHRAFGRP